MLDLPPFAYDSREVRSKVPDNIRAYFPEAIERDFGAGLNLGVAVSSVKMPWGDYLWMDRLGRVIAFERKTYSDLLSSMSETKQAVFDDKTLHKLTRQLWLCTQHAQRTYLVLEGTPWVDLEGKLLGRRHVRSVEQMLRRYELEGRVIIWMTRDPMDTAKQIVDLYCLSQRESGVWPRV